MADKLVKDSAIKKLAQLTKTKLSEHDNKLGAIESVAPNTLNCNTPMTLIPENTKGNLILKGIKGKTYQNLIDDTGSMSAGSADSLFTSTFLNNDLNDSIGMKINVQVDMGTNSRWAYILAHQSDFIMRKLKPNTTYTILFDVQSNVDTDFIMNVDVQTGGSERPIHASRASKTIKSGSGRFCKTFTTKETLPEINGQGFFITWERTPFVAGKWLQVKDFMLIEGDCTANPPVYFEGSGTFTQSTQQVETPISITTTSKNLLHIKDGVTDKTNLTNVIKALITGQTIEINCTIAQNQYPWMIITDDGNYVLNGTPSVSKMQECIKGKMLLPKGTYTPSINQISGSSTSAFNALYFYDVWGNRITSQNFGLSRDVTQDIGAIAIYLGSDVIYTKYRFNLQIESGTTATAYEPYQEFNHDITLPCDKLMSLPNGVCDEIKDGKIIKRIGKVVLREIWNWQVSSTITAESGEQFQYFYVLKDDVPELADGNFVTNSTNIVAYKYNPKTEYEADYTISMGANYAFKVRDDLFEGNIAKFTESLWSNYEVTVFYEKKIPEIIDLELPKAFATTPKGLIKINNAPVSPTIELEYKTGLQGVVDNLCDIVDVLTVQTGKQAYIDEIARPNLLPFSSFADMYYNFRNGYKQDGYNYTWSWGTDGEFDSTGTNCSYTTQATNLGTCAKMEASFSDETNEWNGGWIQYYMGWDELEAGKTYTFSGEWAGKELEFERDSDGNIMDGASIYILDGGYVYSHDEGYTNLFTYPEGTHMDGWQKWSKTVTMPEIGDGYSGSRIYFVVNFYNGTGEMYFRNLKIEEGDSATAWLAHVEDTAQNIEMVENKLTDIDNAIDANNVLLHGNFDNKLEFEKNWVKGGNAPSKIYHGVKSSSNCMYFNLTDKTETAYIEGYLTGMKSWTNYTVSMICCYDGFNRATKDDGVILEVYRNDASNTLYNSYVITDTTPNTSSYYGEWHHKCINFPSAGACDVTRNDKVKIRIRMQNATGSFAIKRIWIHPSNDDTTSSAFYSCVDDKVTAIGGIQGIIKLTQAEYDALGTYDNNTLYIVTE